MIRTRLALALLAAVAALPAHAFDRDVSKVNGGITVEAGEQYGALDTVNGGIDIGANARVASAETVNGGIEVGAGAQTGALETVNGGIRIEENVTASGGVSTVNGGIFVGRGGKVAGSVETVNGAIGLVDTDVDGDIETVNGDVTVGIGSHVRGGLHYEKPGTSIIHFGKRRVPRVVIGPNARVDGPLRFEREVVLYVHATAKTGAISGASAIRFDTPQPPEQAEN
ncbi:DUF4097 family beta strand repeat-containing protein [Lysobacter solisilvae (ex Woo and Kim 2020)]|uniref:Polymer-forming cytoskeletal protein n=1 Tax=Agrilutibacter terrestris TaxID=2865112 RepID=A0A7H0G0L8_9GAMM|nr:hypothetical protein [Lysobacter terrestris]QNP41834.1 hypothetical protein H8B22_06425 [Lysobacter terrestris]